MGTPCGPRAAELCYDFFVSKKPHDKTKVTKTTEFEVEGIEEAYEPARPSASPAKPYRGIELPKLQVETPPELKEPEEHTARIWILERRARGFLALFRRWLVGKTRK